MKTTEHYFRQLDDSLDEKSERLDNTGWGKVFSWSEIQTLASVMSLVRVPKGTVIFEQGEKSSFLGIVVEGAISIQGESEHARSKQLVTVKKNRAFGEMSLLDDQPRSATAIAKVETVLFLLERANFTGLSERQPRIWGLMLHQIAHLLSQRLRATSSKLLEVLEAKDD